MDFLKSKGYKLICNLSRYNLITNPSWGDTGYHNDYLFTDKNINSDLHILQINLTIIYDIFDANKLSKV